MGAAAPVVAWLAALVTVVGLAAWSHLGGAVVVAGESMAPALPRGSLIQLEAVDAENISARRHRHRPADNGVLVTHRVVRVADSLPADILSCGVTPTPRPTRCSSRPAGRRGPGRLRDPGGRLRPRDARRPARPARPSSRCWSPACSRSGCSRMSRRRLPMTAAVSWPLMPVDACAAARAAAAVLAILLTGTSRRRQQPSRGPAHRPGDRPVNLHHGGDLPRRHPTGRRLAASSRRRRLTCPARSARVGPTTSYANVTDAGQRRGNRQGQREHGDNRTDALALVAGSYRIGGVSLQLPERVGDRQRGAGRRAPRRTRSPPPTWPQSVTQGGFSVTVDNTRAGRIRRSPRQCRRRSSAARSSVTR